MSAPDWSWLTFDLLAYVSVVTLAISIVFVGILAVVHRENPRRVAHFTDPDRGEYVGEYERGWGR